MTAFPGTPRRAPLTRSTARRAFVAAALALGTVGTAGCQIHLVTLRNPCPAAAAAANGKPSLPRLGVNPHMLKAQQDCSH